AAVAFFGGFVVFGIVGAWHQDRRKLATSLPGYREFCASAPFFPFTRPGALRGLRELTPAVAIGIAATIAVRYFHASLFGGWNEGWLGRGQRTIVALHVVWWYVAPNRGRDELHQTACAASADSARPM